MTALGICHCWRLCRLAQRVDARLADAAPAPPPEWPCSKLSTPDEVVRALPLVAFGALRDVGPPLARDDGQSQSEGDSEGEQCIVCCDEYEASDIVRRLPCGALRSCAVRAHGCPGACLLNGGKRAPVSVACSALSAAKRGLTLTPSGPFPLHWDCRPLLSSLVRGGLVKAAQHLPRVPCCGVDAADCSRRGRRPARRTGGPAAAAAAGTAVARRLADGARAGGCRGARRGRRRDGREQAGQRVRLHAAGRAAPPAAGTRPHAHGLQPRRGRALGGGTLVRASNHGRQRWHWRWQRRRRRRRRAKRRGHGGAVTGRRSPPKVPRAQRCVGAAGAAACRCALPLPVPAEMHTARKGTSACIVAPRAQPPRPPLVRSSSSGRRAKWALRPCYCLAPIRCVPCAPFARHCALASCLALRAHGARRRARAQALCAGSQNRAPAPPVDAPKPRPILPAFLRCRGLDHSSRPCEPPGMFRWRLAGGIRPPAPPTHAARMSRRPRSGWVGERASSFTERLRRPLTEPWRANNTHSGACCWHPNCPPGPSAAGAPSPLSARRASMPHVHGSGSAGPAPRPRLPGAARQRRA
jgi:hypothetical protein